MNLYEALRQTLPYDIVVLTEDNFEDFREVFDTNREFLVEGYGELIDEKDIFGTIAQLVDGLDPADKYLAAICQDGAAIAAVDLLANSPAKGELYLSFLVVHGDLQGRGFGGEIAEGIVAAAGLTGFTKINLGSFDNTTQFWQKQGFMQTDSKNSDFIAFYRSLT